MPKPNVPMTFRRAPGGVDCQTRFFLGVLGLAGLLGVAGAAALGCVSASDGAGAPTGGSTHSGGATAAASGGKSGASGGSIGATGSGGAATGGAPGTGGASGMDAGMGLDASTSPDATAGSGRDAGAGSGTGGQRAPDGGAAGSSGTGTGGTSGSCTVSPVDPAATSEAKNLLCYLYSIYGNHVLSGQQETSWFNPAGDIDYYNKNVGKYPAILGGDYLYPSGTTSRAQAYWAAGGLTMMRYHMGAPPLSDTYDNSKSSTNYANVLTSGTTENASLLSKLDYIAKEMKTLQDAKVAVIFAMYHEVQSNGWFWWAKGTGAQFVQLWQLSFKYLTQTKGIHNVIWLVPYSGSPNSSYFPGKAYADLCGPDEYDPPGNQPFSGYYRSVTNIVGSTFPVPLHETGAVPQPSSMFPSTAPWLLWNIWATYENTAQGGVTYNTVSSLQSAYSSPYTITRDELPKF